MAGVILPDAPAAYSRLDEQRTRTKLTETDEQNFKRWQDMLLANGERLVMYSPNGTAYKLQVDNAGALSTAPYP